jgi:hypothetical protein
MRRALAFAVLLLTTACDDDGGNESGADESSSGGETTETSGVPGGAEHDTGCMDACGDDPAELRCAAVLDCMWNESCQEEIEAFRNGTGDSDSIEDCARDCVVGYRPTDAGDPKPESGDFACSLPSQPGCNAVWDVALPALQDCAEDIECAEPDYLSSCKAW